MRKVPFPGCTIQSVVYLLQSKVYAITTSVSTPTNKLCVLISEDKQIETLDREATFVLPSIEHHSLRVGLWWLRCICAHHCFLAILL